MWGLSVAGLSEEFVHLIPVALVLRQFGRRDVVWFRAEAAVDEVVKVRCSRGNGGGAGFIGMPVSGAHFAVEM